MILFQSIKPKAATPSNWDSITIRQMAEAMRDMDAIGMPVTPDNLKQCGYDGNLVARYGLSAANLARKLAVKAVM